MKKAGSLSLAAGAVAIGTMALAAPAMAAGPVAKVTPNKGLVNNQAVKVKFSGYPANATVFAIQCSKPIKAQSDAAKYCNVKGAKSGKASATGAGTITGLKVVVGKVGSAGQCKSKGSCVIGVAALTNPPVGKFVKISFK